MKDYPTGFSDTSSVIASDELAARGYEVQLGLTPEYAEQIFKMSREPAIREYCPKDSSERFKDRTAVEHWLHKQRAVFLLFKRDEGNAPRLAGYGWAGPATNSRVPAGRTTFALRIGEIGHGQGLATPFSQLVIAASAQIYGAKDFWLETWGSNGAAVHIYHKLNFKTVDEAPGQRPSKDGGVVEDTRIYMSLANDLLPVPNA